MRKYVYSGAVLIAATIVGYVGFLNNAVGSVNSTKDSALVATAIEIAKEGETLPMSNIEVHLTEDREYAIVSFNQSGQPWIVTVAFEEGFVQQLQ